MLDGTPVCRRDWIAYRPESQHLKTVRAFVDFAKQYADDIAQKSLFPGDSNC